MEKARKIKDIEADEISLVDKAANRRKFFITKRRKIVMDELITLLKTKLGEDAISDDQTAKIQALSEDKATILKAALEKVGSYDDVNFPEDLEGALDDIIKLAAFEYPVPVPAEFDIEDIEKAGKTLSKATISQLRKIKELVEGLIGDKEKKTKGADGEKLSDETLAKLEKLEKLEAAEDEALKKTEDDEKKKLRDELDELKTTVEKLGKKKPVKKGLEGQTGEGGGDDDSEEDIKKGKDIGEWPSLISKAADAE
jgi:hypothetical protein